MSFVLRHSTFVILLLAGCCTMPPPAPPSPPAAIPHDPPGPWLQFHRREPTQAAPTSAVVRTSEQVTGDKGHGTGHPAIVRVQTDCVDSWIYGSGVLVANSDSRGLVVTNWHVITCDAKSRVRKITVILSDGRKLRAKLLKADRAWDLAALEIPPTGLTAIELAGRPARPGEPCTIAGYGPKGVYREAAGQCVRYLSPDGKLPREDIEVSATARQGDSGGPILNGQGSLAGILWGTRPGETFGASVQRVRKFLNGID